MPPYNPLDKLNLARSIVQAALEQTPRTLDDLADLAGAGVYLIYYTGTLTPYQAIAAANAKGALQQPIYIGKAIPRGGRKGGITLDSGKGKALRDRLGQHADSISQASNLNLKDFRFRSLSVDDIWIPLGENMLIEQFKPLWNRVVDGFGNKDPGNRRKTQYRSPWDVIHPGRQFAEKLAENPKTAKEMLALVKQFLSSGVVPTGVKELVGGEDEEE